MEKDEGKGGRGDGGGEMGGWVWGGGGLEALLYAWSPGFTIELICKSQPNMT